MFSNIRQSIKIGKMAGLAGRILTIEYRIDLNKNMLDLVHNIAKEQYIMGAYNEYSVAIHFAGDLISGFNRSNEAQKGIADKFVAIAKKQEEQGLSYEAFSLRYLFSKYHDVYGIDCS